MPAVANAVYDAVGVRVDEVPVTPEKILRALQAKAAGKPARSGPRIVPRHSVARAAARDATVGGRRRPRIERTGAPVDAGKADAGIEADGGGAVMMRLPRFRYRAPRTIAEAAAWLAEDPARHDAPRRRHRSVAEHEAAAADAATLIGLRGIGELADIAQRRLASTIGAGVDADGA